MNILLDLGDLRRVQFGRSSRARLNGEVVRFPATETVGVVAALTRRAPRILIWCVAREEVVQPAVRGRGMSLLVRLIVLIRAGKDLCIGGVFQMG